jgi:hypothetical protein
MLPRKMPVNGGNYASESKSAQLNSAISNGPALAKLVLRHPVYCYIAVAYYSRIITPYLSYTPYPYYYRKIKPGIN